MKNTINFDGVELTPTELVCVGHNCTAHIEELNNEASNDPIIFINIGDQLVGRIFSNSDFIVESSSWLVH